MQHLQRASELSVSHEDIVCSAQSASINQSFERQALRWHGGFSSGIVVEWGIPYGLSGRLVPIQFLASVTQDASALWVERDQDQRVVYPPRFAAEGVDLCRLFFISAKNPVSELKAVFLEPLFRLIILNDPQFLSLDDMMFLNHRARHLACVIFVLRPFHLRPEKGNVWARYRINILDDRKLSFVKGGHHVPCLTI